MLQQSLGKFLKIYFSSLTIEMLRVGIRRNFIRFNSTLPKTEKPIETPQQVSARERIELQRTSIKDIFDGFLTTEENFQPIDTKPILAEPRKFASLNTFHRQQVQDEVEKRLRRDWKDVPLDSKRMAYFISYGNYGPREDLKDNLFANSIPEDLPFALPSKISSIKPNKNDVAHKLPEIDPYQTTESRKQDYKRMTRSLDPVSKAVVYLALIVSLIALYRDKYIEVEEIKELESPLLIAEKKRQLEQELKEKEIIEIQKPNKRWYFLWLK